MIVPTPFRRLAGVVLGAATLLLPASLSAQGAAQDTQISTYMPSAHELSRLTASGSYLAARHAGTQRDAGAAAAYYRASLRGDPKNPELLERAFLSVLAEGDVEEAVRLADQVVKLDKNDRIARLVIGVHALKQKKYAVAKQNLTQSVRGPITDLAATLAGRLGELRRGRRQGRRRVDRQAAGRRLVRAVQGSARRPDPRSRRQQEGSRQALRSRPEARRHRAAARRSLRLVAVAQRQEGRGDEGLQGLRRAIAAPSADRRGDGDARKGQAAAAAGRPTRRPAPPKCSTGSARRWAAAAARTSAWSICNSRSISRPTSRWRCCRSPISTSR